MRKSIAIFAFVMLMASVAFAEPNVQLVGSPNIYVDTLGHIVAEVTLRNYGSDMMIPWLIEMQPLLAGQQPLSVVYDQSICDPNTPRNVHIKYALKQNEQITINLISVVPSGTYDVHLFSRTKCANDATGGEFKWTSPWSFWGANKLKTVTVGSVPTSCTTNWVCGAWGACQSNNIQSRACYDTNGCGVGTNQPDPVQSCSSSGGVSGTAPILSLISFDASNPVNTNTVVGKVTIKNEGGAMMTSYILEMQVRPKGAKALSVVSEQETCDSSHPENVHVNFQIGAGETKEISLTSSGITSGSKDVYFLTRTKCYNRLTSDEIANYNTQVRVNPIPQTVTKGICVGAVENCKGDGDLQTLALYGVGAFILIAGMFMIIKR